jgi:perosamine synthetase
MSDNSGFIPLSVPHIQSREWDYVKECLDGGWVSSAGPFVDRFEREFAAVVGARHAIACSSGTAALHLALELAGVKPGDLVLVPTLTFIASVNAIRYCQAEPYFFDADEFYNVSATQVRAFLEAECERVESVLKHKKSGKRVGAFLPVHIFGNAADLAGLLELCETLGVPVVEDAAESLGTRYLARANDRGAGRHTGTLGRLGCFSFNGNKIITTGGGGMIVTDHDELARKAKYLSTQAKDDEARFVHNEVGYNYRLSNVQAAIGTAQLETIDACVEKKMAIFERYRSALEGVPGLRLAAAPVYARNNFWMPALQIDSSKYGENREQVMQRLGKAGIQARPVWELNHRQKPYMSFGRMPTPVAERLHEITLNVPCSVGLTTQQQDRVIKELRNGR